MVRVMSRVPDGHVLEESAIFSVDVIRLVSDLLFIPSNYSRATILQPHLRLWEEVQAHVHYPRRHELVRDGITSQWTFQIF